METKFDLILKGGHIIDPASGINSSMDLAISGGIIGLVEKDISPERSNKIIDVSARVILDSRANPTIETTVVLSSGKT